MIYHTIALVSAVILDLIIGDPGWLFHPIRLIGKMIAAFEKMFLKADADNKRNTASEVIKGAMMWILVVLITVIPVGAIMTLTYRVHFVLGIIFEIILTCYMLAARSLYNESMKVYKDLDKNDIEEARNDLSMIVGRDTKALDEAGIIRASVETVAENTSDGVIAPLLYAMIGGPIAVYLYKAVNTMDSMVGYRNERYEYFGKMPARMDDIFNFIPSRLSAIGMIISAFIAGIISKTYSGASALKVWFRDKRAHTSPNSAQTESACAGALGIRLGGPSYYGGVLKEKPYIGDDARSIENDDIKRANVLMYLCEILFVIGFVLIMLKAT